MKKLFFTFTLLLLLLPDTAANAQKSSHVIGFYNLENLFDIYDDPAHRDEEFLPEGKNKWTQVKYEKKLHNMASVIRAMRDDNKCWHTVLGISEIENRLVIEDLVSQPEIADANYQIVHFDGPDRRGIEPAFLYDPRKFTLLETEAIPFSFRDTKVKLTLNQEQQDYFRTRDVIMMRGLIDGEMFAFYVMHPSARIGGGNDLRCVACEIAYRHTQEMEKKYPGIKIVVMGDMNDNPTDESQRVWLHSRGTIEETGPGDFFCPYEVMLADGYGSIAYRGQWNIFDLELANYNLAHAPKGTLSLTRIVKNKYYGRIFHKPFMTQQSGDYKGTPFRTFSYGNFVGGYSDHYPTYIVISK